MDEEKEKEYNKLISEAIKEHSEKLHESLFANPNVSFASVQIPEQSGYPKFVKIPFRVVMLQRLKDALAVLRGEKEALTQEEIDGLSEY